MGFEPRERAGVPMRRLRVLVFAPHTLVAAHRSGIHRVAMRLIEHLPAHAEVDLVKWDEIEGQLRYCDRADLRAYFRGAPPPRGIAIHPWAHRVESCFADSIASGDRVVVLMPEAFFLGENGNEIHARVIAQSIVHGWTTAAIFYDLIPFKCPGYAERDRYARYLAELAKVDVVLPISRYVEQDLRSRWAEIYGDSDGPAAGGPRVAAVPLRRPGPASRAGPNRAPARHDPAAGDDRAT